MPADASIYGQQQPAKFNTPFEFLPQMLQMQAQQENIKGQREARDLVAQQKRELIEKSKRENDEAAIVRAEFSQIDPATGQPMPPTLERLSGKIGPEKATAIFSGLEALREKRSGNALKDTDVLARVLGGIEKLPTEMRGPAYESALGTLIENGIVKPGQAPAKYDAGYVKQKRTEALSVLEQFKQEEDKRPKTVSQGQGVLNEATGQYEVPLPKTPELGSEEDFIARWAKDRKLDPSKLSPGMVLAAKRQHALSTRAPEKPDKPTYEWAQTAEGTRLMTPDEIRKQGATKPIAATDKGKYKNAEPVLDAISQLSEKINTGQGVLAKMGGGASKVAAKANYDDDVAEFQALVEGFTPLMARALGHTGVLTQQDVDSVKALFPRPGDSKSLRDRKISRVRDIFNKLEGADADGGTGPAKPGDKTKDPMGIR